MHISFLIASDLSRVKPVTVFWTMRHKGKPLGVHDTLKVHDTFSFLGEKVSCVSVVLEVLSICYLLFATMRQ